MSHYLLRNSPRLSNISLTLPSDITIDQTAYENNPNLLSDEYGEVSVISTPYEGQDFYWLDPNLDPSMANVVKGEIKNEIKKSIIDTTYLTPDKMRFTVTKKFVGFESEIDSLGRTDLTDLGIYYGGAKFLLDKDSVYQKITVDLTTGAGDEDLRKEFMLSQNYPNPFNPTTTIKFIIPQDVKREALNTALFIYNILGKEVKTLLNESLVSGEYELKFDGSNLPSGVYFYRLTSGSQTQTRKMMLLK